MTRNMFKRHTHQLTASKRAPFLSTISVLGVLRGCGFFIGLDSFFGVFFRLVPRSVLVFLHASFSLVMLSSMFTSVLTNLLSPSIIGVLLSTLLFSIGMTLISEVEQSSSLDSVKFLLSGNIDFFTMAVSSGGSLSL